jgi:hypothetical protein
MGKSIFLVIVEGEVNEEILNGFSSKSRSPFYGARFKTNKLCL